MSFDPNQDWNNNRHNPMSDPGNPANPNSLAWQEANSSSQSAEITPGMIIAISFFAVVIALNFLTSI